MSDLMKPQDLADRLGVALITLRKWRQQGKGPRYIKLGHRTIRYRIEDVEEWEIAQAHEQR